MFYAPHTLYRKSEYQERDSMNRIISTETRWDEIGDCRCDDNATERFEDKNGNVYIPKYKVVSPRVDISEGDYIQCRVKGTGEVRGEGRIFNTIRCNYLDYMTAYV